jgi:hypothetical protein
LDVSVHRLDVSNTEEGRLEAVRGEIVRHHVSRVHLPTEFTLTQDRTKNFLAMKLTTRIL